MNLKSIETWLVTDDDDDDDDGYYRTNKHFQLPRLLCFVPTLERYHVKMSKNVQKPQLLT